MTSFFSAEGGPILVKFHRLVQNNGDCGDVVKIKTRCTGRIPIWRTFGRIPWHVIPEPPATLQGGEFNVMIPGLRVTLQGAAT